MKKMFLPIVLLVVWSCCSFGCKNPKLMTYEGSGVEAEYAPASQAPAPLGEPTIEVQQQKIIKTGNMGLRVKELDAAKRRVDSLVRAYGGYYAQEEYRESYRELHIRVPQDRFDRFVAAVETGQGDVIYKNISAKEVTEEYLDVQTRLDSKRVTLERYRDILRRATTIKDIMDMEQYVRQLEEEIQSAEGRLRYLDNQAAYSSLELTLSSRTVEVVRESFWSRAGEALGSGWSFIKSVVVVLLYVWPLWVILGGIVWGALRVSKRRKLKA